MAHDLAPLDEDRLVERDADALAGNGLGGWRRHVPSLDRADTCGLVGRGEEHRVADREPAGLDSSGDDPPFVELVDVLDRHPERPIDR